MRRRYDGGKIRVGCLLILAVLLAVCCVRLLGMRREHAYMSRYYRLVTKKATEREVVAQEGKPAFVLMNDAELREEAKRFKFFNRINPHVESKVLVYYADPWGDGDGYVVYVFIDKRGTVNQVSLGG